MPFTPVTSVFTWAVARSPSERQAPQHQPHHSHRPAPSTLAVFGSRSGRCRRGAAVGQTCEAQARPSCPTRAHAQQPLLEPRDHLVEAHRKPVRLVRVRCLRVHEDPALLADQPPDHVESDPTRGPNGVTGALLDIGPLQAARRRGERELLCRARTRRTACRESSKADTAAGGMQRSRWRQQEEPHAEAHLPRHYPQCAVEEYRLVFGTTSPSSSGLARDCAGENLSLRFDDSFTFTAAAPRHTRHTHTRHG
eukprot:2265396-Prymnesium_polylepis.1